MKTDKMIRMRLSTYKRFRSCFPAEKNETMVNYFYRLSKHLELKNE